jgi:hypothetical protein
MPLKRFILLTVSALVNNETVDGTDLLGKLRYIVDYVNHRFSLLNTPE